MDPPKALTSFRSMLTFHQQRPYPTKRVKTIMRPCNTNMYVSCPRRCKLPIHSQLINLKNKYFKEHTYIMKNAVYDGY